MDDLELFRMLRHGATDAAALAALVGRLAQLPVVDRFPLLGWVLLRAATHADAAVRVAAMRAFAGAEGLPAAEAIVRALDDDAADVRAAAVEALAASASTRPVRWAHAVFHRRTDVRRAAASHAGPSGRDALALHLAADDGCRDVVLARLAAPATTPEGEPPPLPVVPQTLPALLDFTRRGFVPAPLARRLVAELPFDDVLDRLAGSHARGAADIDALLSTRGRAAPRAAGDDGIDALVTLFWPERAASETDAASAQAGDAAGDGAEPAGEGTERGGEGAGDAGALDRRHIVATWHRLGSALATASEELARRVVASVLANASRAGDSGAAGRPQTDVALPSAAAAAVVARHPALVATAWLDRDSRRRAALSLHATGAGAPRRDDDDLEALCRSDAAQRAVAASAGGDPPAAVVAQRPDLGVVAGLLRLARSHPYRLAERWFGLDTIVAAFLDDVEGSAQLLAIADEPGARERLLARLERSRPGTRARALAVLVRDAPDGPTHLERLDPPEAVAVVVELLALEARRAPPSSETRAGKPLSSETTAGKPLSIARAMRIAHVAGPRIAHDWCGTFLAAWLAAPAPAASPLGLALFGSVAEALDAERFVDVVRDLDAPALRALVGALPSASSLSYGKEALLARALCSHSDDPVRAWARARVPPEGDEPAAAAVAAPPDAIALDEASARRIESCHEGDLPLAVAPCLAAPSRGLCAVLAARGAPAAPCLDVCVALLGCHDPLVEVATQLARFGSDAPELLSELDARAVRTWERTAVLPLHGHAWLHRYERHAFALVAALRRLHADLGAALARAAADAGPLLGAELWLGVASVLAMWRWRDRDAVVAAASPRFVELAGAELGGAHGHAAARVIAVLHELPATRGRLEPVEAAVRAALPDLGLGVRRVISPWIASDGLWGTTAPRAARLAPPAATLGRIRTSTDVDELAGLCANAGAAVVHEAALRLVELGAPGLSRLVELLAAPHDAVARTALVESVALWPDGPWVDRAIALLADGALEAELRFRLALALVERGDATFLDRALAAACEEPGPDDHPWFAASDWNLLERRGAGPRRLALDLAASPHPHAYRRAVEALLDGDDEGPETHRALLAFLARGTARLTELRRRAARWLVARGDDSAFPVALADAITQADSAASAMVGRDPELALASVLGVLAAGTRHVPEARALWLADAAGLSADVRAEAVLAVVRGATGETVRSAALGRLDREAARRPLLDRGTRRADKLRAVAETFAWGVRIGRELTGRLLAVRMETGAGLGHTRLSSSTVHVTPLPLLAGDANGRAVVEGLVLHEIGHHMFHRGPEQEAVWSAAQAEGIGGLLNLVADEHLERNLRALDASFGDRLKRLASYAFQRSERELPLGALLDALGGRACEVLTATPLGLARSDGAVAVGSGAVLSAMERAGLPFARFVRALRMGLGNRHGDPRVAAALALFRGAAHRHRTMAEMLEVTRTLRDLFGWEASLVETLATHETLGSTQADGLEAADGITQDEIDEEVERVTDPAGRGRRAGAAGAPGKLWIHVGADERFDPIERVEPVPFDPDAHARYAAPVARHARRLRQLLERLGVVVAERRMRLRGARLDRTRLAALALRGDPRVLTAREPERRADLFLGVLVDCSGSMQAHEHIERAKLFATLLAEAGRGVRGVDVRLFGFTDAVIFDAGDAARCAAHGLAVGGGNNDAAALWHAARVAQASRRRAKLLVMISDGLPTECSVAALKGLVARLSGRLGICCAQVAVRPLEEICFPHYVVIEDDDADVAVRKFGGVVGVLVERALRG